MIVPSLSEQQPLLFFTVFFPHHVTLVSPSAGGSGAGESSAAAGTVGGQQRVAGSTGLSLCTTTSSVTAASPSVTKTDVFVCLTLAPIPRWRDCAVSCCGRRARRRSSRGLGWRLSSPARRRMATTSTGRRVEVDGERQVLHVGPSQQTGGGCWGCRF